jgi:hypothetical protein
MDTMVDIDFALAWTFIDPADGVPRQLRFTPTVNGGGQLIAVVAAGHRRDNGNMIALSRPGVSFAAVETALQGWQRWAMVGDTDVNLAEIRRRIAAAGLG